MDRPRPSGINLARDTIRPGLRVSTARLYLSGEFGDYEQLETWIFSDAPGKSHQIIHRTEADALRVHQHIVDNLHELEVE